MKSSKQIFILCLFICLIFNGFIYAQNNTSQNGKETKDEIESIVTQSFVGDDLLVVLDVLSADTGVNIIYDNSIQGIITCNFENLPLSKALEIVLAPTPYKAQKRDGYYLVNEPMLSRAACLISGSVGIANVKIEGLPDDIYTDEKDYYKANVKIGFSGKVEPVKEGYKFNPSFVVYNNIRSDRKKQDYKAAKVSPEQAVGNELKDPAVTQEFFGEDLLTALDVLAEKTKVNIMYGDTVNGIVTCKLNKMPLSKSLEMIFSASDYIIKRMDEYYLITSPQLDDIKSGVLEPVTISGNVGIAGVEMQGFPGNVVTDKNGSYSITVDYGFTGTIKPVREGLTFSPQTIEYRNTTSDFSDQDYKAAPIVCTIEGSVRVEGVRMEGLPGNPVTDKNGSYSVVVSYGWSGTVKPKKEGYTFQPADMTYMNITSDQVQDFYAEVHRFTISGSVGIEGVEIRGLPDSVFSDITGFYAAEVEYGWSGTVKPIREGYVFEPATRIYNKVVSDKERDNYVTERKKYTISGTIISDKGRPVEGVVIESSGNDPVVTDSQGRYLLEVYHSSYGMIKPIGEKYTFSPAHISYSPIERDIANQNFKAQIQMLTISDTIEYVKNKPISGVTITANPGNIKTVTDSRGQFSIQVPYGWSGKVVLSKPGITFSPDSKSYTNITTDIINGIPVPPINVMETVIQQPANIRTPVGRPVSRKILVVPSDEIDSKDINETKEDILVMAEILDERFREPRLIEGVLRDFGDFFGRDNQQTEAVCIQGYGVIFMMEVNYQFSSLSQPETEVETETSSDIDETWEQARQRVLSQETGYGAKSSAGDYEKQMVNILKTELIRTLKYAANIRNIKPDEWVILSVSSTSSQFRPLMGGGMFSGYGGYGGGYGGYGSSYGGDYGSHGSSYGGYGDSSYGGYSSSSDTTSYGVYSYDATVQMMMNTSSFRPSAAEVMTIRVKKSDVDELSSGKMDFEQFREKVKILMN